MSAYSEAKDALLKTEDKEYKMQDPERMAYLQIIDKLLKLVNPEKLIELERLEIDKSLAMFEKMEQYKLHNRQAELELAKAAKQ